MKNVFLVIMMFFSFSAFAQQKEKDENRDLLNEAAKIRRELSLNAKEEHLVYNVLSHVKKRIADIPFGHKNYVKLVKYVDEERVDMMKAILPPQKYKQYETAFGALEQRKIAKYIEQNNEFVNKNGELIETVTGADIVDDQYFDKSEEGDGDENGDATGETPVK
ncbi:MAG: hypothetical protein LBG92_00375 [Prevotellaceae bacterium]|jgi:hypothetical protein|nr:hypothetical protein [Prevotellaceae bacterium]